VAGQGSGRPRLAGSGRPRQAAKYPSPPSSYGRTDFVGGSATKSARRAYKK